MVRHQDCWEGMQVVFRRLFGMFENMNMNKIYILALLIGLAISSTNCQGSDSSVWEFDIQADDVSLHARMAGVPDAASLLLGSYVHISGRWAR